MGFTWNAKETIGYLKRKFDEISFDLELIKLEIKKLKEKLDEKEEK